MSTQLDGSPSVTPTPKRAWVALAVLMLPVLLIAIDNTVLAFALPAIAEDFRPAASTQLWIVDVYSLVLAALLVAMGSLGDRIGRRRLLLIGATGFAVVSAAAAFAPSAQYLVIARAALGVFGAMLMPSTLSLIRNIFADASARRLAIAIWASCFTAGSTLGPIVGGALLQHFHWGSVFLVAVPILLPLLILGPRLVPESRDPNPGPLDLASVVLSFTAMLPFVWAIKTAAHDGLSPVVALAFVAGIASAVLFVRRQKRSQTPMLDIGLFSYAPFSSSILANFLSIVGLIGFIFFISQHLQLVLGLAILGAMILNIQMDRLRSKRKGITQKMAKARSSRSLKLRYSVARAIPRLRAAAERLPPAASTAARMARASASCSVLPASSVSPSPATVAACSPRPARTSSGRCCTPISPSSSASAAARRRHW